VSRKTTWPSMDKDRTHLEFFVRTWVEAVEEGEDMPEESGSLISEEDWDWVKAEVKKMSKRLSGKDKLE
jgi:hypothetical protein